MDLLPVARYAAPRYPTRTVLDDHPELLRLVPRRWRRNAVVLAALTTLCGLLAGCRTPAPTTTTAAKAWVPPSVAENVARQLKHLDERGVLMGEVAMPCYLSENEAREIILEEAKKHGVTFEADAKTLADVPLTLPADYHRPEWLPAKTTVVLDGVDPRHRLAYEYVSREDYTALRGQPAYPFSGEIDSTAVALQSGLSQQPSGVYATFTDPVGYQPEQTREALRQQVRDFVTWLKAEGVI